MAIGATSIAVSGAGGTPTSLGPRVTRQSAEYGRWSPHVLSNVYLSRLSFEYAVAGSYVENAARFTQQTLEVLYLDPPEDTAHDQDCFSRMRRL